MSSYRLIGWKDASCVAGAMIAMVWLTGWNTAQAQLKPSESPTVPGQAEATIISQAEGSGLTEFVPALKRGVVPPDGWPLFKHGNMNLKASAPTPVVPLPGAERKQWLWDLATFKLNKVQDRQILYIYYLWPPNSSPSSSQVVMANAVIEAVKKAASLSTEDAAIWMAFGVEYEIGTMHHYDDAMGAKLLDDPALLRAAAVPVKWSEDSYKFIKQEHDPATFAKLVEATTTTLAKGTYANFGAVEHWSGLAKQAELKVKADATTNAYLKTVSRGPFSWLYLKPVGSFIALDRKIDIEGVEPETVLTSKTAWLAAGG